MLEQRLYRNRIVGPYRCVFLNSLDGPTKHDFGLGDVQLQWFLSKCEAARSEDQTIILFMHTYPSELRKSAAVADRSVRFRRFMRRPG